MKKLICCIAMALAVVCSGAWNEASALTTKEQKELRKQVKNRAKELKKEGWEMVAGIRTLEDALYDYRVYLAEDTENRSELTGVAIGHNPKIGRDNARANALNSYASKAKAQVVGKLKSIAESESALDAEKEIDKFGEAYEQAVNAQISGCIKEHFTLVRTNGTSKEFNIFMSVDEQKAKKAREEAAKAAQQQTQLGNLFKEVTEFIGESVSVE